MLVAVVILRLSVLKACDGHLRVSASVIHFGSSDVLYFLSIAVFGVLSRLVIQM